MSIVHQDKASVVVHGSDGRDLTLCVTSLAQVILNPDCRTVSGFEALIEREWLQVRKICIIIIFLEYNSKTVYVIPVY